MIHIALFEPQIPQNTGNIARTCAATGAVLHLVGPMGFEIDDKKLKRAGLDYWYLLDIRYYESQAAFFKENAGPFTFFSTKAKRVYSEKTYEEDPYLVFGSETRGLPEELLRENEAHCVRLPMREDARSLNLSNSVAVAVYEALRQRTFTGLLKEGGLFL